MHKITFSNLAYGDPYTQVYLKFQLPAFLEQVPIEGWETEYMLFTDPASYKIIADSITFKKLQSRMPTTLIRTNIHKLKYEERYSVLKFVMIQSIQHALKVGSYVQMGVADQVWGMNYLRNITKRIEAGHDSVFVNPMRSALEAMVPFLNKSVPNINALELFHAAYSAMHPLWVHSHVDAPQFTRLPYNILWNSGKGLLAKAFSVTPTIFKPYSEMLNCEMLDADLPKYCKNPYWVTDWMEAPIAGIEPLNCFYPMFRNQGADMGVVRQEFLPVLSLGQREYLEKSFYYPSKDLAGVTESSEETARIVSKALS